VVGGLRPRVWSLPVNEEHINNRLTNQKMNDVTELEQERDYKVHDVHRAVRLDYKLNRRLTLCTNTKQNKIC